MDRHSYLRRFFSLFMVVLLLTGPALLPARGDLSAEEKADALHALGLFNGKGVLADGRPDYALGDQASRSEAATMLIRLLGQERKAKAQYASGALRDPFTDVPGWAKANVTWLYENGYVNGIGGSLYGGGGDHTVTAQQFAAMVLRSLGYQESAGDFTYARALDFAVEKGLLTDAQRRTWQQDFRREGMVEMCYNALYLNMRVSELTLLQKLTNDGVFLRVPEAAAPAQLRIHRSLVRGGAAGADLPPLRGF